MTTWLTEQEADFDEFVALVSEETKLADYPHASGVESGVLIYDSPSLPRADRAMERREVLCELARAFLNGPGVVVFRNAYADPQSAAALEKATEMFTQIIAEQHAAGTARSDHFAKPGDNDRIWNSLEKHGHRDPAGFIDYYSNDVFALASTAWLGPGYQITAQANVVNPGGQAQTPHRDYHLGIHSRGAIATFPAHVHWMSPMLTLQGGLAHVDVPLEAGPTMFLPHSHKWLPGFVAAGRQDVRDYVLEHKVQLPLSKGDFVFFNPAVMHGAGTNQTSNVNRMLNLFQVSSPFGKAMETIDHDALVLSIYPTLSERAKAGWDADLIDNAIAAAADGYAFPTNSDTDPPIGGVAPPNQADLVRRALNEGWSHEMVATELANYADRRRA